ncbi:multidrug resistance-associated protein 4-like protein [Leptotrombidium deliense]|uniref:Multidrug resistance-associated protein 4-like protein n=1 Tax=Leptotrombidium deliense TaxID=299467 RepID=A0A443S6X5_9ACAR|nr:multidrug resistance-associated protein 4-like protein [Leptotrombidium deliense]
MKIFAIGIRRELGLEDFPKAPKAERCDYASEKLRKNWEYELLQSKRSCRATNFVVPLLKSFKAELIISLLMHLCMESTSVAQALLIGTIIRYFSANDKTNSTFNDARNAAIILCSSLVIFSVLRHQFFFYTQRVAIRMKTAISVLIFEKVGNEVLQSVSLEIILKRN